jgi:2-dehydro-3-deoxyphosphogalactonate aldolase
MTFDEALKACGLIAILRGVKPDEVLAVADALHGAGIRLIEVPLNSPDAFASIRRLAAHFKGRAAVGAGTVLEPAEVDRLEAAGGTLCVAPDCNPAVIARAAELRLEPLPGVFTPSEAFAAIRAGARNLKLFPADCATPATVKAWRAVLPGQVRIFAVGGIAASTMQPWIDAGAAGFGIGSHLYRPGLGADDVAKAATAFVAAWTSLRRNGT